MSLNLIKSKALAAFSKIGTTNGTAAPQSDDNRFGIAYEYFIADALAAVAAKRKEQAKEAAKSAGLLGEDHAEATTVETYSNELISISAKTASAAERVDKTALFNELNKKYGAVEAARILSVATKTNKAATSFIFAVK